jgi:hypothetical protein
LVLAARTPHSHSRPRLHPGHAPRWLCCGHYRRPGDHPSGRPHRHARHTPAARHHLEHARASHRHTDARRLAHRHRDAHTLSPLE